MTDCGFLTTLIAAAATLFAFGCASESTAPKDVADAAPREAVTPEQPTDTGPPAGKNAAGEDAALLEDGTHGAFGLKMPRGMIPIQVPAKGTYRFEGTHQLSILRRYLMNQLDAPYDPVEEEGGRILIRQAKVKSGGDPDVRIGLRLFNGSLGGGSVDVWQEMIPFENASKKNQRALPTPDPWRPSSSYGKDEPAGKAKPISRIPSQRRRQVWEMMEKVRRGEKLTPQDMENPYFN